jgi:lysozyme family protein
MVHANLIQTKCPYLSDCITHYSIGNETRGVKYFAKKSRKIEKAALRKTLQRKGKSA